MDDVLHWFEVHPGLAGYVQTLGSLFALIVAIRMPIWQRRSVERAAELSFRGILDECHSALGVVECLFGDDGFDVPGDEIVPGDIAKQLVRATARLESVSLFELKPQCATLVQQLQREMSIAAAQVERYVDGPEQGLDLYDDDTGQRIYRLMLEILNVMRAFNDAQLAATLRRQLDQIDERIAARPRIKRVKALNSIIADTRRSLRQAR